MLIAIGSDGNTINDKVAKRFGHAAYYVVYNDETETFEANPNNDVDHTHTELENLVKKGVKVFIVGNIGPHAFEVVTDGDTEIYLARKMTVEEALESYKSGRLQKLIEPTVKKSINHS